MKRLSWLVIVCLLGFTVDSRAVPSPHLDPILGLWETENHEAVVEFYDCGVDQNGKQICGRFHTINGEDAKETHNAIEEHETSLCERQFIGGFTNDGSNTYAHGWINDPEDGGTYDATLTLQDRNTLRLRGYLFTPLLGESETWRRVAFSPSCMKPDQ